MNANNLPDYSIPANKVPLVEPKRVEKSDLDFLKQRIIDNLKKINGTLIAHYYVDADIQDLAEELSLIHI